jgi:hypothetical protein
MLEAGNNPSKCTCNRKGKICAKTCNFGRRKKFALICTILMSSIYFKKRIFPLFHTLLTHFFNFFVIKHRKRRHLYIFCKSVRQDVHTNFSNFCIFSQAVVMKVSNWFARKSFNNTKLHFFPFNPILRIPI